VAGDDDAAAAGGRFFVVSVFGLDAGFGADVFELLAVLVAANAANVYGRVCGKDVLARSVSNWIVEERGRISTCAPRAVFCAAPPAMRTAL
jgi:hypothetical protein